MVETTTRTGDLVDVAAYGLRDLPVGQLLVGCGLVVLARVWRRGVTMADDPDEAAPRFAGASEAFHSWFKDQILELSGVDPSRQPLGPPTKEVFSWSDDHRQSNHLAANPQTSL